MEKNARAHGEADTSIYQTGARGREREGKRQWKKEMQRVKERDIERNKNIKIRKSKREEVKMKTNRARKQDKR